MKTAEKKEVIIKRVWVIAVSATTIPLSILTNLFHQRFSKHVYLESTLEILQQFYIEMNSNHEHYCVIPGDLCKYTLKCVRTWLYLRMANINRSDTWNLILSFFLSCQPTLSWDTPIPLLFVSLKVSVNLPCSSDFAADLVRLCALTPSWLLRSVITCLITLLSNSRTAHCWAKVAGCRWDLAAWSLTIAFNARSPIWPEKLLTESNQSM
jgi:hypothetical protein